MNELEMKKILITRLIPLLNPAPSVQDLLQRSVQELEEALEAFATAHAEEQAKEYVAAHTRELRRASMYDKCWVSAIRNVSISGKTLIDNESNRTMMENLLQPHEPADRARQPIAPHARTGARRPRTPRRRRAHAAAEQQRLA